MEIHNGLEIEKRFLIRYPELAVLRQQPGCREMKIRQLYLPDHTRIRQIEENGQFHYILTVKQRITDLIRKENERELTGEEFREMSRQIAPGTHEIQKIRFAVPIGELTVEIDCFPFWNDRAILEIELRDETQPFSIPPFVTVIKEITGDERYHNSRLCREVVREAL